MNEFNKMLYEQYGYYFLNHGFIKKCPYLFLDAVLHYGTCWL